MSFLQMTNLKCMCDHKSCCDNSFRDLLVKEQKKVGELMREGVALGEFEDRQRRQIDLWKSKAERLAEALKELDEYVIDCLNWEEDEVKSKKWWAQLENKHKQAKEALADYGKETK